MIIDMGYWSKVTRRLIFFVFSIILFCVSLKMMIFFMPFLIAFIISLCIEPIIRKVINKTKLSRKTSAIIVLIFVSVIIIAVTIWAITSLISEVYNLLQGINTYFDNASNFIKFIIEKFDTSRIKFPDEVISFFQSSSNDFLSTLTEVIKRMLNSVLTWITQVPKICISIGITILAIYFICTDRFYMLDQLEHHFPKTWVKRFSVHLKEITTSLGAYLKAQIILIIISFVIVLIGLFIFKFCGLNVEYPLLAALGIGFVDALPILGSGTVMIPWAIISAINGDINLAIALIILYIVIIVVRQFMEPRIVSNEIGIHPIFTLIAMYTGFKIIGVLGLLVGPIILIIVKSVYGTMIDKGVVKSIFERK